MIQKYNITGDDMNGITHGFGMGFFVWIIPFAFLILFIYLIRGREESKSDSNTTAQNILDRRYASGGISKEEYEEKSKDLQKHA